MRQHKCIDKYLFSLAEMLRIYRKHVQGFNCYVAERRQHTGWQLVTFVPLFLSRFLSLHSSLLFRVHSSLSGRQPCVPCCLFCALTSLRLFFSSLLLLFPVPRAFPPPLPPSTEIARNCPCCGHCGSLEASSPCSSSTGPGGNATAPYRPLGMPLH